MSTSKLQRLTGDLLSVHFGRYTIRENLRPQWLLGPKGERLELDFYIEELALAIEVQGQQHYQYTPHFHGTYEDFKYSIECDRRKKSVCTEYNIDLKEISNEFELDDLIAYILKQIKPDRSKLDKIHKLALKTLRTSDVAFKSLGGLKNHPQQLNKRVSQIQNLLVPVRQNLKFYGPRLISPLENDEANRLLSNIKVIDETLNSYSEQIEINKQKNRESQLQKRLRE